MACGIGEFMALFSLAITKYAFAFSDACELANPAITRIIPEPVVIPTSFVSCPFSSRVDRDNVRGPV